MDKPFQNRTMRDKMTAIFPSLMNYANLPYVGSWKKDGEDHINIAPRSGTIGNRLYFDANCNLDHPLLGNFRCVASVMWFIRANHPDDVYRTLPGSQVRTLVLRNGGTRNTVPNLRAVVMHTAYLAVLKSTYLIQQLKESTLPFDHYRVLDSGIRQRYDIADWVIAGYTEIRAALKEDREPDFSKFMDLEWRKSGKTHVTSADIYRGVLKMLSPHEEVAVDRPRAPKPVGEAPKEKQPPKAKRTQPHPKPTPKVKRTPQVTGDTPAPETTPTAEVVDISEIFKPPVEATGPDAIKMEDVTAVETTSTSLEEMFLNLQLHPAQEVQPADAPEEVAEVTTGTN